MKTVAPRHLVAAGVLALAAFATGLQLAAISRQSLWADEVFSLAIATGHSLEHPADRAKPELGDYVEPPVPMPAAFYRHYAEHERPPAGIGRVIRAVRLSDTNPPLYYVLLNGWTRLFGVGDAALRSLSIVWAVATFVPVAALARRIGGPPAVLPACMLLAASPLALYYATEGRMYSLLFFLAASSAALTLRLPDKRRNVAALLLWILTAAAGLLTHYFFAFVWGACLVWLLGRPGRLPRRYVIAAAAVTVVLVAPWYLLVPETFRQWRVTAGWLAEPLSRRELLTVALDQAWGLLSGRIGWTALSEADYFAGSMSAMLLAAAVVGALAFAAFERLRLRVFSRRRLLVWLWLGAVCVGPVAVDVLNGTRAAAIPRYALAGLPAAILLAVVGLSRLRVPVRVACLLLLVLAWSSGVRGVYRKSARMLEPYRDIGRSISATTGPADLVLVHSIPSGVIGLARYLDGASRVTSWVGQLRQRQVPADAERLTAGSERVLLVKIHTVGEPAPEEAWLRSRAEVLEDRKVDNAHLIWFRPHARTTF